MTPESASLFHILLGIQIILLIIAGISRKENLFLANVNISCICVAFIRLFIRGGGGFVTGSLLVAYIYVIVPFLFRIVDAATFLVCANVKNNTPFRLRWRKIFGRYLIFSLILDAIWLLT